MPQECIRDSLSSRKPDNAFYAWLSSLSLDCEPLYEGPRRLHLEHEYPFEEFLESLRDPALSPGVMKLNDAGMPIEEWGTDLELDAYRQLQTTWSKPRHWPQWRRQAAGSSESMFYDPLARCYIRRVARAAEAVARHRGLFSAPEIEAATYGDSYQLSRLPDLWIHEAQDYSDGDHIQMMVATIEVKSDAAVDTAFELNSQATFTPQNVHRSLSFPQSSTALAHGKWDWGLIQARSFVPSDYETSLILCTDVGADDSLSGAIWHVHYPHQALACILQT
jgi:hypothetical protein